MMPYAKAGTKWADLPKLLKQNEGVQVKGDMVYATGMAVAKKGIRQDKAFEAARKKSLLRAMQIVNLFAGCSRESLNLAESEYQTFISLFAPTASKVRIKGLQVIRQWESGAAYYTAVAVSLDALPARVCPFDNMAQAVDTYIAFNGHSMEGLAFCLKHTSRYTALYNDILVRVGQQFRENRIEEIAGCFDGLFLQSTVSSSIADFVVENYMQRASRLVNQAQALSKKGKWADAIANVSTALQLVPTYGPAHLVIADYLSHMGLGSDLALPPIKAALRTGTVHKEALTRLVVSMEDASHPEAQIFRYLLDRSKPIQKDDFYTWADHLPDGWRKELKRFKDDPVLILVVVSLGNVVTEGSKPPAPEFHQAVGLFQQSSSNQDIERVIDLLIEASRKESASADTYNLMGACFRHLQKYELALPFFWQALNLKPEYDLALVNLGLCCQALKANQSAKFYFEHHAVVNSSNGWVRSSYEKFKAGI
jgi:tetratricopeptide (TPR) repeat protein